MCGPKDYQTIEDAMNKAKATSPHGYVELAPERSSDVVEAAVQAIRNAYARDDGFVLYVRDRKSNGTRGYGNASIDDMREAATAMSNDILDMMRHDG